MQKPSNWHPDYKAIIDDAQYELDRFKAAVARRDQPDMDAAIKSFYLKLGPIIDWVTNHVKGDSRWAGVKVRDWVGSRSTAMGRFATADVKYKHAVVDTKRHDDKLDEISMSAGGVVRSMTLADVERAEAFLRGRLVTNEQHVETEQGPAVCSTYLAPKLIFGTNRDLFIDEAEAALAFWRKFDPSLGPNQVV